MKPILRNFVSVIRRYRLAVVLNIMGLSVAFAAFMVIMSQLNYDFGFDKFHKDYDRIYRVEVVTGNSQQAVISRPLAERFFESSPHIVAGTIVNPFTGKISFHVENDGVQTHYEENSLVVSPEFFDVFTFDFVEGSKEGFGIPGNILIPLSLSHKLFGHEPAVGKQLIRNNGEPQTVMAVYHDLPSNSIFDNRIYYAMPENYSIEGWKNFNCNAYIRVNEAANAPLLFDNFKRNFDLEEMYTEWGISLHLTVLPDIHYVTDISWDDTPKASKQTLLILFAIAMMIITIAGINFTNFSTALTPMRVKSINTQRILGARQSALRLAIVTEAMIISFLSYLLAIYLVEVFNSTPLARLVDADLSFVANPLVVVCTALMALLVGLLAGLYPSFNMTSFIPALALKGNFGLTTKGKKLRNTLITFQYTVSFALIIGASYMYLQNYFMQNSPLGYDKEEIITVDISQIQNNRDAFTNQLKAYAGIEDVTFSERLLAGSDRFETWVRKCKGEDITYQALTVHHSFLKVMGIEITEGRDFREGDANLQSGVYVFNETAHNEYNLELGSNIEGFMGGLSGGEVIGFVPDIKIASFRSTVEPMAFYVWGTENWNRQTNQAYIKVKAGTNKRAAISYIHATLADIYPNYTFEVRFFDEVLQRLYEKEIALGTLITLFSLIAIFISIAGVFGLVVFDSECRRKEIGIRKVFGASTKDILLMFNKTYFRILLICFVIASPLAWYAVHRWLENFAYKTPMYWWVYLLAFVAVGIVTVCTVTFQNRRVANDNPVNSIKSE